VIVYFRYLVANGSEFLKVNAISKSKGFVKLCYKGSV
jgi:hypothetical protein